MGKYKNSVVNVDLLDIYTQEQINELINATASKFLIKGSISYDSKLGKLLLGLANENPNLINLLVKGEFNYGEDPVIKCPISYKIAMNSSMIADLRNTSEPPATRFTWVTYFGFFRSDIEEVLDYTSKYNLHIEYLDEAIQVTLLKSNL